jgi:methionine-rich copper-binding protein CopC
MRCINLLTASTFLLCSTLAAHAHATLDRSDPAVGSELRAAPHQVTLWYTQKLEPALSSIEVRNSAGERVDQGRARVDPSNHSVLRIGLKPLPPGTYKVIWRVLSADTHTTQGSFTFQVGDR